LDAAKTAAGVARVSPRDLPRKQTFIANPNGTPIIFQKSGSGITPMFALKKSVTIPPRLQATGAFMRMRFQLERDINNAIENIWSKKR